MIELVTAKDFGDMWTKVQELVERTKNHTKQIQELQRQIKEMKESNTAGERGVRKR